MGNMLRHTNIPIGFMQGRLSPVVNDKIQAFPWDHWKQEFKMANKNGFNIMEWTLDQERLYDNPLMTKEGQQKIRHHSHKYNIAIPSLTGDCFMQSPFWKIMGDQSREFKQDFLAICNACSKVNIHIVVVPLVDNGSLENKIQEDNLISFFIEQQAIFDKLGLTIVFESDYSPIALANFIKRLPSKGFGINYDIGNSAAFGFDPIEEFAAYGDHILNVHIKDRELGGTTVPLGSGNANFKAVFSLLFKKKYKGNYILQTSRAKYDNHESVLCKYSEQVIKWIENGIN